MTLTKIQRIAAKNDLDSIKNTKPKMKLISHLDYARLSNPKIHPYHNKNRLYREVSDKIHQSLLDFHYAFMHLPESYKKEILTDKNFIKFVENISHEIKNVNKKLQLEEPEKTSSFILYYNFFIIGLEGLLESMPEEFRYHIREQMRETLALMQAIADFSKKSNSKSKVPFIYAPSFMRNLGLVSDNLR